MKKLFTMQNQVQKYAWGTPNYIADLLQVEKKDDQAWAELWMSSHAKAPSLLTELETNLNDAISKNPQEFLGSEIAESYGNKLPYLFKILSAGKPLSIQAHPNLAQAKAGFARENKDGILLTDFIRNYKDDNHKPELICALTDFHAMCGFRPASEIIEYFTQLDLKQYFTEFPKFENNPTSENWEKVLIEILSADVEKKLQILNLLAINIKDLNDEIVRDWVMKMFSEYPDDIGALSPLFLNTFILKAGQAIFLKAGILHAYLYGTGVEIMANSDNVLRGGLTPKNIDVKELVSILNWEMKKPEIQSFSPDQEVISYQIPIKEFSLKRINIAGKISLDNKKPSMIIVIKGEVIVSCDDEEKRLTKGNSIFITSQASKINLTGEALLFLASTNN